ncbi:MAG TPA: amino acid adenylation domain-containing protein [Chthoniobacteraceae bacterium]
MSDETTPLEGVAIVGLAGRFPGARDVAELWQNLCDGVESISTFTDEELLAAGLDPALIADPNYVRGRATLADADQFDAAFFGLTPRDAELTDPQHRVFLECAWHALEDAALDTTRFRGAVGVFAGASLNTYLLDNLGSHRELIADFVSQFQADGYPLLIGSDKDYLATRVSYKLDLRGPSVTVQTACSTSLVAVCQAVQALLSYQCDAALAGGVSITFPQERGHLYQEGSIASGDGHCRPFDAEAKGTVFGHGCGVVVLKRLADAVADRDQIYAVIKGAALNNDGAGKASYLAPSADGQAEVISLAQAIAGVTADSIDYVEAHGTGTPLGDPIEVAGLTQAFRATTDARGFCLLGAAKSNFGHLEAAAGVTGLIKTALALRHEQLPPTLHFTTPNPRIDFANSPFRVVTELTPWTRNARPRRAGVSSFGVGGTNAHVVLEEAPTPTPDLRNKTAPQLLVLSAKTRRSLEAMIDQLSKHLRANPSLSLADVAFTLQTGRRAFEHRLFVVASEATEAAKLLRKRDRQRVFTSPLGRVDPRAEDDPLTALGHRWLAGEEIDWHPLHSDSGARRISLPGYAFDRKKHWIAPLRDAPARLVPHDNAPRAQQAPAPTLEVLKAFLAEQSGLDLRAATGSTCLLELGFDSLFLTQAAIAIQKKFGVRITFRQLLEGLNTLGAIADYLDANASGKEAPAIELKAAPFSPSVPAAAAPAQHGPFRPVQKDLGAALTEDQQHWLEGFVSRYSARTPGSKRHTQTHRPHFADPRAVAGFKQVWKELVYPIVVERSQGAHLWDVDGHDYVDTTMGFGLALFGHQPDFVMRAIEEQMKRGMEIGPSSPLAGEVAQLLCEMTGHERATFCNTGSEAVLGAIRIARTVTGRQKIALFSGAYHGINDEVLVRPLTINGEWRAAPIAPGIIQDAVANVLVLEYGNPQSLEILRAHADDLAAVLVEPVQSRRPDLQPREFLQALRALTTERGVALIMDEVITGFRCHPGGAQAHFGVKGDIATYGKVIGGGLPIGAITGRAEYLDAFDGGAWQFGDDSFPTAGVTFFAGTFVRHPLALAAARAVLVHLKEHGVALQDAVAERVAGMIRDIQPALEGTPFDLPHFASLFYLRAKDFKYSGLLYALLRHRGVHIWEGRPCFLSTAHTDEDVRRIVTAFHESLAELKQAGFIDSPKALAPVLPENFQPQSPPQEESIPLTEAQREVWFASQMSAAARAAFNESCTIRLRGGLNVTALQQALDEVIRRHDALRSRFDPNHGAQTFRNTLSIELQAHDFTELAEEERATQLGLLLAGEGARDFDLEHGPLLAAQLVKLEPYSHALVLTAHHIACDGWSYDIILRELASLYSSFARGAVPKLGAAMQFADYARTEQRSFISPEVLAAESYWKDQFSTLPPTLELPTDRPRPPQRSWSGARCHLALPGELKRDLAQFGARQGATLFAVLLASFETLLHRLTGATDLVVGVPAAGQNVVGGADLVGHCANLLPLRTRLDPARPFTDLLRSVRGGVLDAFEHQQFTLGRLLAQLKIPRDAGRVPLVPVIFNLDPPLSDLHFGDLKHEIALNPRRHYQFDLGFNLVDEPEALRLECDYNPELFDQATVRRWLDQYAALLRAVLRTDGQPLSQLDLLSAPEQEQVLAWSRGARTPYPADQTIHSIFARQVAETPDAIAVIDGKLRLTYAEVDEHANRYANHLLTRNVGEGDYVGLFAHRYWPFVAEAIGILKIGAAYVPLDPRDPPARLASLREHLAATLEEKLDVSGESVLPPVPAGLPEAAAYVMFTSGSTGEPKGAVIPHQGVTRLVCATDYVQFSRETVMMQGSNLCFDASTFEIWGALLHGGTLVFTRTETLLDHQALAEHIARQRINSLFLTTSLFNQHARQAPEMFAGLECVVFGGEAADPAMVQRVLEHGRPKLLVNGYGPTETTTFAVCQRIEAVHGDRVPIGRPIANTDAFILDEALRPVPPGVSGEIYLGGPGVALGYLHRPELTAERFLPTPHGRLYRTGDFGRWLPDGTIEYQGRIDQQFKLRGFRIEPAEIEAQLRRHPAVAQAAVLARPSLSGEKVPVAYLVRKPTHEAVSDSEFREYLVSSLPPPFVPYAWFWLEALPLTANGKLDHRALPDVLEEKTSAREHVPPVNTVQAQLIEIWEEVLRRRPIGIRDDFFELGGHSLLAARVITLISERLGQRLPFADFFSQPTVENHARALLSSQSTVQQTPYALIHPAGTKTPVFFFHGDFIGGGFFCKTLAQTIGADRPFYAVHPHGLQGDEVPLNIETMAAERVRLIRKLQPHGPYILGGYCNGSFIAYHAARLLRDAGESVATLLMLMADGSNARFRWLKRASGVSSVVRGEDEVARQQRFLNVRRRLRDREDMGRYYAKAAADLLTHPPKVQAARLWQKAQRVLGRNGTRIQESPRTSNGAVPPAGNGLISNEQVRAAYGAACSAFVPEHSDVPMILLWPKDEPAPSSRGPAAGWESVCPKLKVIEIPGQHHTCISQNSHVVFTGERMRSAIQEAENSLAAKP